MADCFISYRRIPSAPVATILKSILENRYELDVYLDTTRVDSTTIPFPQRLMQAITDASVFICLLGEREGQHTLQSEWVIREIEQAYHLRKFCIPVFQEGYYPLPGMPPAVDYLLSFDGIHIFDQMNIMIDESVERLAYLIRPPRPWWARYRNLIILLLMLIVSIFIMVAVDRNSSNIPSSTPNTPLLVETSSFHDTEVVIVDMPLGISNLYTLDINTGNTQQLTDSTANEDTPAISPDRQMVAFSSDRDGNDEIFVMNADGSNIRQLTFTDNTHNFSPAWSPDGLRIAFINDNGISAIDLSTGEVLQILDISTYQFSLLRRVAWLSNLSLVFPAYSDTTNNSELYTLNIVEVFRQPKQLTNIDGHIINCVVSPDGEEILFISNHFGYDAIVSLPRWIPHENQITSLTPLTGTAPEQINYVNAPHFPIYMPDQNKIVFSIFADGYNIAVLDRTTREIRQLTFTEYYTGFIPRQYPG